MRFSRRRRNASSRSHGAFDVAQGAYVVTFGFTSNYLLTAMATLSDAMHALSILGGGYMLLCAYLDPARRTKPLWTSLCLIGLQTVPDFDGTQ